MDSSKFATMLNKNTSKIRVALVYAALEIALIVFLFLNALFSYLIIKFADYFRLKRPCLWCSRIDHIFEPEKFRDSFRSLLCEAHAIEISKLGYCSDHKKLAELQAMCEDCLTSSKRVDYVPEEFSLFSWMSHVETAKNLETCDQMTEKLEVTWLCSCCGASIENKLVFPDCHLIDNVFNDSDNHLESSSILVRHGGEEHIPAEHDGQLFHTTDQIMQESKLFVAENIDGEQCPTIDPGWCGEIHAVEEDDKTVKIATIKALEVENYGDTGYESLEFLIDSIDCHLIPVNDEDEDDRNDVPILRESKLEDKFAMEHEKIETRYELIVEEVGDLDEEEPLLLPPGMVEQSEPQVNLLAEQTELCTNEISLEEIVSSQATHMECIDSTEVQESLEQASERIDSVLHEPVEMLRGEIEDTSSIATKVSDQELVNDCKAEKRFSSNESYDHAEAIIDPLEFKIGADESKVMVLDSNSQSLLESNEYGDVFPDTPTSIEGFHHLHKKFFSLERRESCTEESFDGSIMSDIDASDTVVTIERLKSALRTERKALHSLYAELEEERNASAVAANQTMAMINRLQEEKAAVQMEALQYQRMMDEQTEYDQEALQLLNELMLKREREKDELERELVFYRKRVENFECREKVVILKKRKGSTTESGTPTSSCSGSNSEIRDDLFVQGRGESSYTDTCQEVGNHDTPADAVVFLEDLANSFESQRLAILQHVRVLEGKLFVVGDEDEQYFENGRPIAYLCEENGDGKDSEALSRDSNNVNKKHCSERRNISLKAKRLLPLFDAIDMEAENGSQNCLIEMEDGPVECQVDGKCNVGASNCEYKVNSDCRKRAIEEEMEHVYDRLYALEADREFLKHCIFSLRKGDKGVDLLQEILQHLRDLRKVEFRARSSGEESLDGTENKFRLATSP